MVCIVTSLTDHLHLFQHAESGEVLVVSEKNIRELSFITDPNLWYVNTLNVD